jgi:hypothetical protein
MKTSLGKTTLLAVLVSITSHAGLAQNPPAVPGVINRAPGLVNRDIERLTLLPGPFLLSPARTTPTMMPAPMKLQSAGEWRFVPAPKLTLAPVGGTRAADGKPADAPSTSGRPTPPPKPSFRPPPESLHFDAKLEATLPRP